MAIAISIVLAVLALFATGASGQGPIQIPPTQANISLAYPPAQKVFSYNNPAPSATGSYLIQLDPYSNFPALQGVADISQGVVGLSACDVVPFHTHIRATELLFVYSGRIQVTFSTELKARLQPQTVNVSAGETTFIPAGLPHTEYNPTCQNASYVSTFSNADPGTMSFPSSLLQFPGNIITASFGGVSAAAFASAQLPQGFATVSDCAASCGIRTGSPAAAPGAVATLAPATAPSSSSG